MRQPKTTMIRTRRAQGFCGLLALATLLGGLTTAAQAATKIYKPVEADGNVVYTDVAPKEPAAAEEAEVKLSELNQFVNPEPEQASPIVTLPAIAEEEPEEDASAVLSYESATLTFPANDQPVRANNGAMTLQASVAPALDPDHRLRFFIDGKPVGTTSTTSLAVSNVDRGTHDVQFVILDADGAVLAQSPSHVFHLLRVSVR